MYALCKNTNTGRITVKEEKKINLSDDVIRKTETKEEALNALTHILELGLAAYREEQA